LGNIELNARRIRESRQLLTFTADGVLPAREYSLTLDELRRSLLIRGPVSRLKHAHWDTAWREQLVDNLKVLVKQLWQVGITGIFVDGSFVEDKDHPNDIDGYFECDLRSLASGQLERELNQIDPHKVWTWDPKARSAKGSGKRQLPMWHRYHVELYPHAGQLSGIRDQHGNELDFPAAFRLSRSGIPKGIIKILRDP
jgi:hypothetical protein